MKKICKSLLLTLLAVALMFNTFGIVLAETTTASIAVREEALEGGVSKLVFKATTPAGADGVSMMNIVFSYDESKVQLIDSYDATSETTNIKYAFNPLNQGRTALTSSVLSASKNGRTAIAVSVSAPAAESFNATAGADVLEFYYKISDGQEADSETFTLEKDLTDGSFIAGFYPTASNRIPAFISTITVSGSTATPSEQYKYIGNGASVDTLAMPTFTYTGSDKLVLDHIELSATAETVNVPTVYPAEAAATLQLTATAISTIDTSMDLPADAVWSLLSPLEGVSVSQTGLLTVEPGAAAGTARVNINSESKSVTSTKDITISRDVLKAGAAVIEAKADEEAIEEKVTVVKPATEGSKSVVFTGKVYSGYGEEIDAAEVTFSVSEADLAAGITFANNTLTVTNEAPDCNILAEATYGALELPFSIDVVGLVVDWTPVTIAETITYGMTNADIVTLPADNKGTASVDGATVTGTFAVLSPEAVQDAGNASVVVAFTADETVENGEYAGMVINQSYDIAIAKADIDMSGVVFADKTAKYTGSPIEIDAPSNLPVSVEVTSITYDEAAAAPTVRGRYTVVATLAVKAEYADNYNVPEALEATLEIERADAEITATDKTYTYTGEATEFETTATLNHTETELDFYYVKVDDAGVAAYSAQAGGSTTPSEGDNGTIIPPTDAGVYQVTISARRTDNYNEAETTVTLTIEKATALGFVTEAPTSSVTARQFAEDEVTLDTIKARLNSDYSTATVNYGTDKNAEVSMTWGDAAEEFDPKGGTYTFVGTPSNDNLSLGSLTLTATFNIEAVTGELDEELTDIFIKKAFLEAEGIISHTDINFPWSVTINLSDGGFLTYVDAEDTASYDGRLTWSKTLEELCTMNIGDKVDVSMTTELPEWLTFTGDTTVAFEVTEKDPVTVTVTQPDGVYGTALEAPVPAQADAGYGTDDTATYTYAYTGTTAAGADYESADAPTQAGNYTVTATVVSDTFAGSGSVAFEIAPLAITAEVGDATKVYGDANPVNDYTYTATGVINEDDLGVTYSCAADEASNVGTYDITAVATNKNYDVDWTNGTLTIEPKDLAETDFVPVIGGTVEIGTALTASVAGLAADQYTIQWYVGESAVDGATTANYTPILKDSGKVITVAILGRGNYTGDAVSEDVTVPKYEIEGSIAIIFETDNGVVGTIDATDVMAVDTTGIVNYADLIDAGISLEYIWKINGTEVARGTTYTVPAETTGVLTVEVATAVDGNFVGSIESGSAEINKAPLTGTITITPNAGEDSILKAGETITATATLGEATADDYDLKWFIGETELTLTEGAYEVTAADYGKTLTVKAIAKGDAYTGTVVGTYVIPAIAPSDVAISTSRTATSITATLTAKANGATISSFSLTITDDAEFTQTVTVTADESGAFVKTFDNLTTGTQYTLTATATNSAGTSEAATATATPASASRPSPKPTPVEPTPDTGDGEGSEGEGTGTEGEGTTTPDADVTVKVEDTTASIDKEIIADKEAVEVATETESGTSVTTTVNVAGANVESLEVSTKDSEKAAAGAAAEGAVGTPVEVKVDAKDAEGNKANVTVNVAIPSEEKAYAYIIDENGVATRTESVYNEETGEVEVANVPDGAVVMLSTTAPATFDDAAAHWAEETINYAVDAGIMNGVGGGAFDPDGQATRGMVNAMMVRLAKVAGVELAEAGDHKVDTDAAHWAAATDLIALANGWTTGVRTLEDGTVVMDTDATVTREQLVTMLWRFVANPEAEGEIESFDDHHETSDWAKEAKAWAVGAGIINGKPGNKLDPNGTATRAEIATMFGRLMAYMTK